MDRPCRGYTMFRQPMVPRLPTKERGFLHETSTNHEGGSALKRKLDHETFMLRDLPRTFVEDDMLSPNSQYR